ncbi:MAG TPA: N-acetylmuramoyl-L-alanine amidase, partial [Chthoniobacterales bacterium]|nr:N-acetylmuramoyl-L-alanine amidase [Chthoniobacterales bacterium]
AFYALFLLQLAVSGVAAAEENTARVIRVAIDIGHTPGTSGAMSAGGVMEYTYNKRMAQLIADDLRQQPGIVVTLVNPTGREISLLQRGDTANQAKADLFLSVHHDSVNERYKVTRRVAGRLSRQSDRFRGYSVFYSDKNAEPAASLEFAKQLGRALREQGLVPTAHHAEKIPGEGRDFVLPEYGVYRFPDLLVLKRARMPAVLLECGVIVHPEEEEELNTPERQRQIVAAVRTAVLHMRGVLGARREASATQ